MRQLADWASGFTFTDLERELAARGGQVPGDKQFKLLDWKEGKEVYRDGGALPQPGKIIVTTEPPAANEKLARFTTPQLVGMLLIKNRELQLDCARGIWGLDQREDICDIPNEQIKENARCVAAICLKGDLKPGGPGFLTLPLRTFETSEKLCAGERFGNQPVYTGWIATGFLVEEDVIATACHCLDTYPLADYRFIFGFQMVNGHKVVDRVCQDEVYEAKEIIDRRSPNIRNLSDKRAPQPDWALIKLNRKVVGQRKAEQFKGEIRTGQPVYMIGHPRGLPLKAAPGASVCDIANDCFASNLDVFQGNSGSPVFDGNTHEVVGLLTRTDEKDFRETPKGVKAVVYPNFDIYSYGPQCTMTSKLMVCMIEKRNESV